MALENCENVLVNTQDYGLCTTKVHSWCTPNELLQIVSLIRLLGPVSRNKVAWQDDAHVLTCSSAVNTLVNSRLL